MSDVIKLQVLDMVETIAKSVEGIRTVIVNPIDQPELDTLTTPALFMYDRDGDKIDARNRLEVCDVPLTVQIWVEGQNYARRCENLRGLFTKALYEDQTLRTMGAAIRDTGGVKHYGELDQIGFIEIQYALRFQMKRKDPFSIINY